MCFELPDTKGISPFDKVQMPSEIALELCCGDNLEASSQAPDGMTALAFVG